MFSTGSGSPQTVDVTNVSKDAFFEVTAQKDGDKYKVNDVTSAYETAINSITTDGTTDNKVYSLDGRLAASDGSTVGLPKGIYIVNKRKVIVR